MLAALNLVNPDGLIAGVNLARAAQGRPLDLAYAAELSADALPSFRRVLPSLVPSEGCATARALDARWAGEFAAHDRWTIGLARASRVGYPMPCAAGS